MGLKDRDEFRFNKFLPPCPPRVWEGGHLIHFFPVNQSFRCFFAMGEPVGLKREPQ
jgi:hypothetical protein